jgi:flagellar hook-associated protein 3 FlgL
MVMSVSTSQYFDNASKQLSTIQNNLAQTQTQLSTSLQVVQPSDAPDKTSMITKLNTDIATQSNFTDTLKTVQTQLQAQDTAFQSVTTVLTKVKELTIQAANATLNSADRQTIALQITQLRDQILSIANSQDVNGNYIFAGAKVSTPAFLKNANGVIDYNGDQTRSSAQIGTSLKLQMNMPGSDAFVRVQRSDGKGGNVGVGFFQSLGDLISAVQNSDQPNIQRGLSELTNLNLGITEANANVGTSLQAVDSQTSILSEINLRLKSTLSDVQDLDYTTAITKMNKDQLALEAAQSSFAKISKLSLFTYM